MDFIKNSIFDIFKLGPGPSSSHTIAPMLAANKFIEKFPELKILEVHFYGSLALTGIGHGSDKAIIAGLLGENPDTCNTDLVNSIKFDENHCFKNDEFNVQFVFHNEENKFAYQNTLEFRSGNICDRYFSIGGGFIINDGMPDNDSINIVLPYRYNSMDNFKKIINKYNISAVDIILENEKILQPNLDINDRLNTLVDAMLNSVERGLHASGILPGELKVERRAKKIFDSIKNNEKNIIFNQDMLFLDTFALAVSEENATGNLIVTAPTSGSAGVIPSLIYYLINYKNIPKEKIFEGLIIAGFIGMLAKNNASISGAEVGCQGEIGVATSMGAALLAQVNGDSIDIIERAAEIALEHYLGLTCDPIGGYVQIPCIERNAVASTVAFNAYLLAYYSNNSSHAKVTLDEALKAMLETGCHMSKAYKETSLGGLAKCSCCI